MPLRPISDARHRKQDWSPRHKVGRPAVGRIGRDPRIHDIMGYTGANVRKFIMRTRCGLEGVDYVGYPAATCAECLEKRPPGAGPLSEDEVFRAQ